MKVLEKILSSPLTFSMSVNIKPYQKYTKNTENAVFNFYPPKFGVLLILQECPYIRPSSILVFLILVWRRKQGMHGRRGCAVCKEGLRVGLACLRVGAKWGLPPDQSLTLSPTLNLLSSSFSSSSHSYLIPFLFFLIPVSSSKWGLTEAIRYQIRCFFTHCVKGGGSNQYVKIYVADLYHSEGFLTT